MCVGAKTAAVESEASVASLFYCLIPHICKMEFSINFDKLLW